MPEEKEKVLTIDPDKIKEGSCSIMKFYDEKLAVCKEDNKIKIFPIMEEENK